MSRRSTGTVRILLNDEGEPRWHGKWTRADGSRSDWLPLPGVIALDDEAGAKACAARLAPKIRQASVTESTVETVEQYAKRWLDDRDGRVSSIRDDRARMRDHVLPTLGPLDVRTFTRDDVERVRDALDEKVKTGTLSWKTAGNVWTLVKTLSDDTANARDRALRVRADNPATGVKPPRRGKRKEKQYLYPSEFLAFLNCPDVPRKWKIAAVLALYSYGRDGEVAKLDWRDIDLEHGVLRITRARDRNTGAAKSTKTGATRRFSVEPTLLPLLQAMFERAGEKGTVFEVDATHLSRTFRRWLLVARVNRHELHTTTATSRAITWHDLRASAATWMAVRGDKPLVIRQRCGHSSFATTELYIREAEVLTDGFGEVFPPLPDPLLKSPRNRPGRLPAYVAAKNKLLRERDTGLEPATFGLGSRRSTN